jgi:hypothetical protein
MAETVRRKPADETPELEGTAGYVSPYPYLDKLQPRMDERLQRDSPIVKTGRYCAFCYGRLRKEDTLCGFCESDTEVVGTVGEIPQDVLRAYLVKKKTEEKWVHLGAFFGLTVATFLFVYLVLWGPWLLGHPAFGFAVLLLGGYVLAQFFGPLVGGQVGYRKGAKKRDAMWAEWLEKRGTAKPA